MRIRYKRCIKLILIINLDVEGKGIRCQLTVVAIVLSTIAVHHTNTVDDFVYLRFDAVGAASEIR